MDIFDQRDAVLKTIHSLGSDFQHTSDLRKALPDPELPQLQEILGWLGRHKLLDLFGQMPGDVGTFKITPLGEDFAETGTSTRVLAERAVAGAIMNQQTNYNFSFAQNTQGDNNTISVHQSMNAHLDEIKSILSDKGYEAEAKELETIENTRGPKRAISRVAGWINEKFFSPEVLSTIAPIAGQAALDTF